MNRATIILCVLLTACVHVSKSVLSDLYAGSPVPAGNVAVLLASMGDTIPWSCDRLAILHASGSQEFTNEGMVLDKLREETGKLGGNAVYVQGMEEAGTGEKFAAALLGTQSNRDADAIALRCN